MASTPLIKPLNTQGGTFYSFTSAAEDISLTFNNDNKKFRFSKYVLLNIPNFQTPSFNENSIQFDTIDGAFLDVADGTNELVTGDLDIDLAQSFQNYCLNLEALVISNENYDPSLFSNVSERIFWKWMKELGAIRFRDASTSESSITDPRFVEEDEVLTGSERYNRIVKYIGEIDIVNNVNNNANSYTELYIHIPNKHGNTPTILFRTEEDVNYGPGRIYRNTPENPLNIEYLVGREFDDSHPSGLSNKAIYDQDVIGGPDSDIGGDNLNWYDPLSGPNAYFTDESFIDPENETIIKTSGLHTVTYKRSKLDGIKIDFDPDNYKLIIDNPNIDSIDQFNGTSLARPFDFNAVLVYYDVYNPQMPENKETNLFGILFLEDIEPISLGGGRIPSFKKFVPDPITKLNGNSFAFKINLKFDTSSQSVASEKSINTYSTFSLEIFTDTTNALLDSSIILSDKASEIVAIKEKLESLESLFIDSDDENEIKNRLLNLEESMTANQTIFDNSQSLLDLINKNADNINSIISGDLSESLTFDLDVFSEGSGIELDKSINNRIIFNNKLQAYNSINIDDISKSSESNPYVIILEKYSNYFRHSKEGDTAILSNDLYIRIDDEIEKWKKNQIFRIAFDTPIELGSFNIIIQTDSLGIFGSGEYGKIITVFSEEDFSTSNDRPIFDIICIDPDLSSNNSFIYDKIR